MHNAVVGVVEISRLTTGLQAGTWPSVTIQQQLQAEYFHQKQFTMDRISL